MLRVIFFKKFGCAAERWVFSLQKNGSNGDRERVISIIFPSGKVVYAHFKIIGKFYQL